MQFKNKGFSLIELMIVVVILAILAMIAIPSYQDYTKRARFAGVIMATEPYKIGVALALQKGIPTNELDAGKHGIPAHFKPDDNVSSIDTKGGVITATASEKAGGDTYILEPDHTGSHWTVTGTCLTAGLCDSN